MTYVFRLRRTDRIFVTGRSGSGKTFLAKSLIRNNLGYNFIVLDVLDNYRELDRLPNVARFIVDPLDEYSLNKIIVKGLARGVFFVLDEMHSFPFGRYQALRYLILAGRNRGCGWIAISQFPSQVSKSIIGNANYSFIFPNMERNALQYLSDTYEVSVDELRELEGHQFYFARYSQIMRRRGRAIKFILKT